MMSLCGLYGSDGDREATTPCIGRAINEPQNDNQVEPRNSKTPPISRPCGVLLFKMLVDKKIGRPLAIKVHATIRAVVEPLDVVHNQCAILCSVSPSTSMAVPVRSNEDKPHSKPSTVVKSTCPQLVREVVGVPLVQRVNQNGSRNKGVAPALRGQTETKPLPRNAKLLYMRRNTGMGSSGS